MPTLKKRFTYPLRSKRIDSTSEEDTNPELIQCDCGYEQEFPLGEDCPGCGQSDESYHEDESIDIQESEEEDTLNDLVEWKEAMYIQELKEKSPEMYEHFMTVREYLVNEIPKVDSILTTPMDIKDKARIIELYEVMMGTQPLTIEWISIKQELNDMIKRAVKSEKCKEHLDPDTRKRMAKEVQLLDDSVNDTNMEYQISALNLPLEDKIKIFHRFRTWERMDMSNEEYGKAHTWLTTVLNIPWGKLTTIPLSEIDQCIHTLKDNLDRNFYGMDRVKEQLLLYMHHRLSYPKSNSYMLGLLGPPGCGKTGIVHVLSQSLGIPFYHISGGSLSTNDSIYGHSYTYIGAEPGEIAKACLSLRTLNGIAFIDEFEKIPMDKCLSALLQLIDPVQNHQFKDRYLDMTLDLSNLFFIGSMNALPQDKALADRIFSITLDGYTFHEKQTILQKITIPRLLKTIDIPLKFTSSAIKAIMSYSNSEPGMRHLIQLVQYVFRKFCFLEKSTCTLKCRTSESIKNWTSSVPITAEHIHAVIDTNDIHITSKLSLYA